jgi:hypothetical protein
MTAALKFLSNMANTIFERQMSRAAHRICAHQQLFPHRAA